MTTISASLRLRPTRIGFLVDPQDADSLRRIFQVCPCLGGGGFNPIIPVCSTIPDIWKEPPSADCSPTELARGYLEFFEPDVFVESRAGLAEQIGLGQTNLDLGDPRTMPLDAYFAASDTYGPSIPFGMNIFDIYDKLYDREFKFVRRHEHRVALFEPQSENRQ